MIERLFSYDEVTSTNDVAKKMVEFLRNGDVIWALKQNDGHGKGERSWYSPEGGLWFSVIFKPSYLPDDKNIYTKMISVAVVRTLKKAHIEGVGTKWPNDLYYGKKKIGGILTEIIHHGTDKTIIIGVGLNVNNTLPVDLPDAISLKEISGRTFDLSHLLKTIHYESLKLYTFITKKQTNVITNFWRNSLIIKKGSQVRYKDINGEHVATVVRIFADSFVIEMNGIKERVSPSEIESL
jgi:BirA family biotin operon repressor/biotin-[acetyl-CoA-carboxylase] ligase|uniref:Biotin--[acetyl-CoA-carboxylase] ligase n=1 Tax=Mesoaciditoga lauensis TaxID=1495039 RepID=A0A7V3REC0_9BACT